MAKIETEKVLHFQFHSKMHDVGIFKKSFILKRATPKLDTNFIRTKAALVGGEMPVTQGERLLIDAMAVLWTYFIPINDKGAPTGEENWIDDILDREIILALQQEYLDYQESFYQKKDANTEEVTNEGQASV